MAYRIKLSKIILLLVFLFPSSIFSQKLDHVQGDILVQLQSQKNIYTLKNEFQFLNGTPTQITIKKELVAEMNIWKIHFDYTTIDESIFLEKIKRHPVVLNAQFNHLLDLRSTIPNDPDFPNQWQYLNDGSNGAIADSDVDADLAWDISTGGISANGDTIVVCVIDAGIDHDHEDLTNVLWINHNEIPNNGIDDDNNGFIDDVRGWNSFTGNDNVYNNNNHGSAVAGIIGAEGNNNLGGTGMNWDAKLMIVLGGSGDEAEAIISYSYPLSFRKKYNQTQGTEGAFVVATNASWGVDKGQANDFPLWCAMYDSLGQHGILNCGATANDNWDVEIEGDMPTTCSSDFLIGVTNINSSDLLDANAAYGAVSIDLGAPGALTWSTQQNNSYGLFAGTSAASPQVAGAIALLYSAPCSNLPALAINDPSAAALQVKNYILDGVDPNNNLQGITFTGGRLNVFNSIQMVMDSCGICPAPSSLIANSVTDMSTILTWVNNDSTISTNLRYRTLPNGTWVDLMNVTSPYALTNLTGCTEYEVQVESVCSTEQSGFVYSHFFKTDDCCEPPNIFLVNEITDTSALVSWTNVFAAEGYVLELMALNPPDSIPTTYTSISDGTTTEYLFSDLPNCQEFQVSIQVVCDTGATNFALPIIFETEGCGACRDADYCEIESGGATLEWIANVSFNTLNNSTGSDDGYGDFTDLADTELEAGSTYSLSIMPGYQSSNFNEFFSAWIDYNQDGDFEDVGEKIFTTPTAQNTTATENITIPNNAVTGSTRMRVLMRWAGNNPPDPPPCVDIDFGEIEDYCVFISGGTGVPCSAPTMIDTVESTLSTIAINWNTPSTSYESFNIEFRKLGAATWETKPSNGLEELIGDLDKCSLYEFRIQSICDGNTSSNFSDIFIFNTRCDVATEEIEGGISNLNIFPNPFSEKIFVTFTLKEKSDLTFEILSPTGQSLFVFSQNKNAREIVYEMEKLQDLPKGIYFLKIKTEKNFVVKRVVKR